MYSCLVFKRGKEKIKIIPVNNVFIITAQRRINIMNTPQITIYMMNLGITGFKEETKKGRNK